MAKFKVSIVGIMIIGLLGMAIFILNAFNNPIEVDSTTDFTLGNNTLFNSDFSGLRANNSSLPENWSYDNQTSTNNFNFSSIDFADWNLGIFNLTNESLFFNAGGEEYADKICNVGESNGINSYNFTLNPNRTYQFTFDVKAFIKQNNTSICNESTGSPVQIGWEIRNEPNNTEFPQIQSINIFLTNSTNAENGTFNLQKSYENVFKDSSLSLISNNTYKYSAKFTLRDVEGFSENDSTHFYTSKFTLYDNSAEHSLDTYFLFDNMELKEFIPEQEILWLTEPQSFGILVSVLVVISVFIIVFVQIIKAITTGLDRFL